MRSSIQDKRNHIQIFGDILDAINQESPNGKIKTTRIQLISNVSSIKLKKTLTELEKNGLVASNPIVIKEKGRNYINDYEKMKSLISEIGVTYLENESSDMIVGLNIDSSDEHSKHMILHEYDAQTITQFTFHNDKLHDMKELEQIERISDQIKKLLNDENAKHMKNKNLLKLYILIIDNNQAITTMLGQFFSLKGHRPTLINDGLTGLNEIITSRYDVILLDLSMPKLNGLDIINELHKKSILDNFKIIVLTASNPDQKIIDQINAKNIPILEKPINMKHLEKLIEN